MGAALQIEGLWEGYRPKTGRGGLRRHEWYWALRDLSLEVEAGELVGIIGGNGSGKTTLLRCITGVLQPTRGRVHAQGRVSSLVELTPGLSADLTGRENLNIAGVLSGMARDRLRQRYDEIVDFTGIPAEVLGNPIRTYSAGMILRLTAALVLHSDPDVLAVDEVLAVGDEGFREQCLDRVDHLRAGGCAVALVSHDADLVQARCDRVLILDQGEPVFLGSSAEAIARYHAMGDGSSGRAAHERYTRVWRGRGRRNR